MQIDGFLGLSYQHIVLRHQHKSRSSGLTYPRCWVHEYRMPASLFWAFENRGSAGPVVTYQT